MLGLDTICVLQFCKLESIMDWPSSPIALHWKMLESDCHWTWVAFDWGS